MILLIIGVVLTIAGFVVTAAINSYRKAEAYGDKYEKISFPSFLGLALGIIFTVLSCVAIVPTGYTGILTTFGRV